MKLTRQQLRQIIKEELEAVLNEEGLEEGVFGRALTSLGIVALGMFGGMGSAAAKGLDPIKVSQEYNITYDAAENLLEVIEKLGEEKVKKLAEMGIDEAMIGKSLQHHSSDAVYEKLLAALEPKAEKPAEREVRTSVTGNPELAKKMDAVKASMGQKNESTRI